MPEWFKGTVCKTVVRWFKSNCGLKIYGVCSSEEEHLVVVQDVVGSIPISHPLKLFGSLAQWIRALLYERRGWGFKSLRNHIIQVSSEKVSPQSPKLLLAVRIRPGLQIFFGIVKLFP